MTLAAPPEPKRMTIDQFVALPDMNGHELVEGRLVERKHMGALSDYVAQQVSRRLGNFCEEKGAGHVFGSETTYRCFGHPDTGRRADVSFIARGRLPGEIIPLGYVDIPADVVVEVLSPYDLAYEVEEKVELYLSHGFGEVWVVYPNTQTLHVHRSGQPTIKLGSADVLRGRGPLAAFECPVSHFFPPAQG